jgi:hypothetical protein
VGGGGASRLRLVALAAFPFLSRRGSSRLRFRFFLGDGCEQRLALGGGTSLCSSPALPALFLSYSILLTSFSFSLLSLTLGADVPLSTEPPLLSPPTPPFPPRPRGPHTPCTRGSSRALCNAASGQGNAAHQLAILAGCVPPSFGFLSFLRVSWRLCLFLSSL